MKKAIVIVVLLCIVAAGGAVWYINRPAARIIQPAELLPAETLMMIEAVNLKKSLDEFRVGPLGKAVSGIDMPACMGAFNADPEEIEQVSRLQSQLKAGVDSPWFDTLFGELVVVAFLQSNPDDMRAPAEMVWRESAIMVLRPKKPAEMIQWIGRMFAREVTVTAQTVDGIRMDRVETGDGLTLFITIDRGLGLVALDPKPIVRCLTPPEGDVRPSLAHSPDYVAMRKELGAPATARFFAWVDLHGIFREWHHRTNQGGSGDDAMAEVQRLWGGFNQAKPVVAAVATDDGDVIHHRWRIRYNAADLSPDMRRMLDVPPEINTTLPWVPETTLYYSWQNNLGQVLASALDGPRLDANEAEAFKREFTARTGTTLEDAVNAFGSQFAVMIRDIKTGGMFPVPELALMAETVQPALIDRLVETAVRNSGVVMVTEEYRGERIRYVGLPYGEDISPGYAVRDGFLVVASSRGLLKALLTRGEGWTGLADTPSFNSVIKGSAEPSNQMVYFQVGDAAASVKDLLKWALSLAVMTGKAGDANQMIYLSNKVVEPILDGLSMYPAMGAKTIIGENGIQSDIYVLHPRNE